MHWFVTGLPLALIGSFCTWRAFAGESVEGLFLILGVFYLVAAGGAASQNPGRRKVAVAAWAPLLLVIPIGTVLGLLSMRWLLDNSDANSGRGKAQALTPEAAGRLVRRSASVVLDVSDDQWEASLERDLQIPPVDLINFLRDLHIDYGLPISGEDRKQVESIEDVVQLVTTRMSGLATRDPSGMLVHPDLAADRSAAAEGRLSPYRPPSAEAASP